MPKVWMRNGKLLVGTAGRPVLCDVCPCAPDELPDLPVPRYEIACAAACERLLPRVLYVRYTQLPPLECQPEAQVVTGLAVWSNLQGGWVFVLEAGDHEELGSSYVAGVLRCGFGGQLACDLATPFTLSGVITSCPLPPGSPFGGGGAFVACEEASPGSITWPLHTLECGPPFYLRFGDLDYTYLEFFEALPA